MLATSVDQAFIRSVDIGYVGYGARTASVDNHVVNSATRFYDADGNLADTAVSASQDYAYTDPFGACWHRSIAASRTGLVDPGALTAISDGSGCPGEVNALSWFDAFYNYGSSVDGATVQLLP